MGHFREHHRRPEQIEGTAERRAADDHGLAAGRVQRQRGLEQRPRHQQWNERAREWLLEGARYDKDGQLPVVGKGEASLWEFEPQGAGAFVIRAAEGKWKGWYLTTSDRAFKDGPGFGFLLELGKQPQTFYVYQVSK